MRAKIAHSLWGEWFVRELIRIFPGALLLGGGLAFSKVGWFLPGMFFLLMGGGLTILALIIFLKEELRNW